MDTLIIRPIKKSDCFSLSKLIKEFGESETCADWDQLLFHQKKENNGNGASSFFISGIVAELTINEKDVVIIGVALHHIKYSTWEGEGPALHVNTFIVENQYRRLGVGSKLLKSLIKTAKEKSVQISAEIRKNNEVGMKFFEKHGAINLTTEEGWLNYQMDLRACKKLVKEQRNNENNVALRRTEIKDCVRIQEMIQELNEFEDLPDLENSKLSVEDLQRDGFHKHPPDFYSFVAELKSGEIIGYTLLFLELDPFLGKMVHLEDIYVTPKFREKGVGVLLFQEVARFVEQNDCYGFRLEVLDKNNKAIEFYEKLGGKNRTEGPRGVQSFKLRKTLF